MADEPSWRGRRQFTKDPAAPPRCSTPATCPRKPPREWRTQPTQPAKFIRGIRLCRLPPAALADLELNGGVSRKRSSVMAPRPLHFCKEKQEPSSPDGTLLRVSPSGEGRTSSSCLVGPMTRNTFVQSLSPVRVLDARDLRIPTFQTAPPLTWERGMQTILDLVKDELELDDAVAGFNNASFCGRAVTRVWELG